MRRKTNPANRAAQPAASATETGRIAEASPVAGRFPATKPVDFLALSEAGVLAGCSDAEGFPAVSDGLVSPGVPGVVELSAPSTTGGTVGSSGAVMGLMTTLFEIGSGHSKA